MLEYNPAPPFNAGSPDTAPAHVIERLKARYAGGSGSTAREAAVVRAAARLKTPA